MYDDFFYGYDEYRPDGDSDAPPFGQQFAQQQLGPPFGQPFGQGQFGPPFGMPFGQGGQGQFGQQGGPPSGPPPSVTPQMSAAGAAGLGIGGPTAFIDAGAIRPCMFRYVFLWLRNGRSFWAWLIFVGRRSVAGWRWTGFRWVYFGVDLNEIRSFYCF